VAEHQRNLTRKDWLLVGGVLVVVLAVLIRTLV
jgi:hypothetical protein